jgi:hypothetical protein
VFVFFVASVVATPQSLSSSFFGFFFFFNVAKVASSFKLVVMCFVFVLCFFVRQGQCNVLS